MINDILSSLSDRGMRGAFAPISRIGDLKRDMESLKDGEFRSGFIDWWLTAADKLIPEDLDFTPRSLITVIAFSPKMALKFTYKGKAVECILPPTYAEIVSTESKESEYINELLSPFGYKAAHTRHIPQKMLAVHNGLGKYGRNNIFYDHDFGSYAKIYTYISDMPCEEADCAWHPIARMDSCKTCKKCVEACPTKAIDASRLVINADICVTAMNERDGAFPEWLDKSAHNSLVGCMKCQDCCPANDKNAGKTVRGAEFTEKETMALLGHKQGDPVPDELSAKLESTGLWKHFINHIPRNLGALLGHSE
jgi:epoxyqueuosine reductase